MNSFRSCVDSRGFHTRENLDPLRRVEFFGVKREPFLRRVTGEVVLREIGSIVRRVGILLNDGDWTSVALPAKHLGAGITRGPATDYYDRLGAGRGIRIEQNAFRCRRSSSPVTLAFWSRVIALSCNPHDVVLDRDIVGRQVIESRRARRRSAG